MSKFSVSKTASIFAGIIIFTTIFVFPVFAVDDSVNTAVGPEVKLTASEAAAVRANLLEQRAVLKKENTESKLSATREKLASRAAALKVKLQSFKDQKKAEVVERINNNLNAINQNQTSLMQKNLGVMSTKLDLLENRINLGMPDIKNPSEAKIAIASARAVITSASSATTEQSMKDYTIQVTSETRIKSSAKLQRDKLHTDLLALRKQILEAKQAAVDAVKAANSGSGISDPASSAPTVSTLQEEEASSSGQ